MFTGIIEDIGQVVSIKEKSLSISTALTDINPQDSVAVNGVCLTAVTIKKIGAKHHIYFDLGMKTRQCSNLDKVKKNDPINLERSRLVGERLSGHFVLGHVETIGKILEINLAGPMERLIKIAVPETIGPYLISRGSIAVDGVSLTIAEASKLFFIVDLVPETLRRTNLQFRRVGEMVNIEPDILARYARVNIPEEKITLDKLRQEGYI